MVSPLFPAFFCVHVHPVLDSFALLPDLLSCMTLVSPHSDFDHLYPRAFLEAVRPQLSRPQKKPQKKPQQPPAENKTSKRRFPALVLKTSSPREDFGDRPSKRRKLDSSSSFSSAPSPPVQTKKNLEKESKGAAPEVSPLRRQFPPPFAFKSSDSVAASEWKSKSPVKSSPQRRRAPPERPERQRNGSVSRFRRRSSKGRPPPTTLPQLFSSFAAGEKSNAEDHLIPSESPVYD